MLPKQNVEELFLTFPNRFKHRFEEPDLTQRQWELDNSFDENLKSLIENEVYYYEGFDSYELFVRHWFYCSATAPFHETCFDLEEFRVILDKCKAGDILEIWSLTETPKYYMLNCPNQNGLFPKKGSH